jgi:hypothetical protein
LKIIGEERPVVGSADNRNHQSQLSGPPLRRIDEPELQQILEHHQQWVDARDAGQQTAQDRATSARWF